MKKIIPARTISLIAELLAFASAHSVFAKPQKKSAQSSQENAAPLVEATMKNMETGVQNSFAKRTEAQVTPGKFPVG